MITYAPIGYAICFGAIASMITFIYYGVKSKNDSLVLAPFLLLLLIPLIICLASTAPGNIQQVKVTNTTSINQTYVTIDGHEFLDYQNITKITSIKGNVFCLDNVCGNPKYALSQWSVTSTVCSIQKAYSVNLSNGLENQVENKTLLMVINQYAPCG
jgi:hypothetical protein